ncbi:MAG TPA: hopanoid biosynthesis-associated protein HpnK [Verrucomicrobiae bacterium]|jgi:hopanoid biosynthesis associated protein HpnK|nr:hopanoid biosynthesis-associated protein HpnK [Verrucomicrobiae bacterium]
MAAVGGGGQLAQLRRRVKESREQPRRRLIVNADDFGRSASINEAVIRAHREGILTTASLMVNEADTDAAVELARQNPGLGVGLHLALVCGRSALPQAQIPHLVDAQNQFSTAAPAAGLRYFLSGACRAELRAEIKAQFARFHATGLTLDHVNGHLHLHLHPVVFDILAENAARWKIKFMRLTVDPLGLNARLAPGQWLYRLSHAAVFGALSARARPHLRRLGIRSTERVFGLLQNARVDAPFVRRLLPELPPGDSELYSHPSLDQFKNEFDALVDPPVKEAVARLGIQLIRYQDL